MRPHLHLLGILQLAWGAIGLLLGVSMLLLAIGAIAIGVTSGADRMAAGLTAGAFTVFAVALLAGGGANAWAGRELRRNRPRSAKPRSRPPKAALPVQKILCQASTRAFGQFHCWLFRFEHPDILAASEKASFDCVYS